jgi:hypothetical protein
VTGVPLVWTGRVRRRIDSPDGERPVNPGDQALHVVHALFFFPRGGSAQVARSLTAALPEHGVAAALASGSLGGPGDLGHAPTFFRRADVATVDYTPAAGLADPLAAPVPFQPSFEDRPGSPDRVFAAVGDEPYERLVEAWAGALERAGKYLVLCGDFNVARSYIDVHPALRKDMIGQSAPERTLIEQLLSGGDLVDVGRHVEPDNDRLFTWWAPWRNLRQRNMGWRLDYVAASRALVDETVHCTHYRDVGTSDHGPVIAHLRDAPLADAERPA